MPHVSAASAAVPHLRYKVVCRGAGPATRLSNLLSARSLLSHKGASKMLRATGHARMVSDAREAMTVGCKPTSITL